MRTRTMAVAVLLFLGWLPAWPTGSLPVGGCGSDWSLFTPNDAMAFSGTVPCGQSRVIRQSGASDKKGDWDVQVNPDCVSGHSLVVAQHFDAATREWVTDQTVPDAVFNANGENSVGTLHSVPESDRLVLECHGQQGGGCSWTLTRASEPATTLGRSSLVR